MFDHLSVRTRTIIRKLLSFEPVDLSGNQIDPFREEEARLLFVVAEHLPELSEKRGKELADAVVRLCEETTPPRVEELTERGTRSGEEESVGWKLGVVGTCSFRGLAPAGMKWEHDFDKQSFLIFGPNGSGKSSLLGAVAWCLTGQRFRDDCQPGVPEDIQAYTTGDRSQRACLRPDALALTGESNRNTRPEEEYWVELQLISEDANHEKQQLWVRRSSVSGLTKSADGDTWSEIQSVSEAKIDELDAELHVLMPARVPYVSFGKNQDLSDLFSALVGLNDLQNVVERTTDISAQCTRNANLLEQKLSEEKVDAENATSEIHHQASDAIKDVRSYAGAIAESRDVEDVQALEADLNGLLDHHRRQLATDLGFSIPSEGSEERPGFQTELETLPGYVEASLGEIKKGIPNLFSSSIGFSPPDREALEKLKTELDSFEGTARIQIEQRFEWATREAEEEKLTLMIEAAKYFPEDSAVCPVCEQDLEGVPQVKRELDLLRPLAEQPHLSKAIDDLDRELRDKLEGIVEVRRRSQGEKSFAARLFEDWQRLRTILFRGVLETIRGGFDDEVTRMVEGLPPLPVQETPSFVPENQREYRDMFKELDKNFAAARGYIALASSVHAHRAAIDRQLTSLLVSSPEGQAGHSLAAVLEGGRKALSGIKGVQSVKKLVESLCRSLEKQSKIRGQIDKYRWIEERARKIKSLGDLVRGEVFSVIGTVETRMKEHYARLYPQESFLLDKVTPGHAANPDVKGEVNAYFLAGEEHVPIGPFSNAGRLRALAWSLVFALLDQAQGSLGFIILDDPAQSLDDEHKARLVDHLIARSIDELGLQVITATHYENFFKNAEPALSNCECVQMHPSTRSCEAAGFEPSDLLARVQQAVDAGGGSWREAQIDIRIWTERALKTLSSYCPAPFVIHNNIPDTIDAYSRIDDPQIATGKRDEIVRALQSAQVVRVINPGAHDEDLSLQEIRDALDALKDCRKHVEAEIKRLKDVHRHRGLGRGVLPSPCVLPLPVKAQIPDLRVEIVAEAAAASEGRGMEFLSFSSEPLACNAAAVLKASTLAPIARPGQYLLLGPEEGELKQGDIVVVKTESGEYYARRYWVSAGGISLENANPTDLSAPVLIESGRHSIRKAVGVWFEGFPNVTSAEGKEWFEPNDFPVASLERCKGVRVDGASMEPVARNGQIALIRADQPVQEVRGADLACVDIENVGVVIKRCYPGELEWILLPVNPNQPEDPMIIPVDQIRHKYPVAGILFETESLRPEPTTADARPEISFYQRRT